MKKSWLVIAAAIPLVILASVAVWKVSGNETRRQGALPEKEAVNLSWRGDWSAKAEYVTGNVVSYDGASYVAEGEKLATPKHDCSECGWAELAIGSSAPEEEKAAAPAEPVIRGYQEARATRTVSAGATGMSLLVTCPTGKMPLNGGATSPTPPLKVTGGGLLRVDYDASGVMTGTWAVQFDNTGGPQRDVQIWAVCAKVN